MTLKACDAFCIYGMWGIITDPGQRTITARLQELGCNTHASPYSSGNLQPIADAIMSAPKENIKAIIGASLGGNNGPEVTAALDGHRDIDLLVGFQPSEYGAHIPVSKNVKLAICIFNPNWIITFGLGNYCWVPATDNDCTIIVSKDDGQTFTTQKTGTNGNVLQILENNDAHPADFDVTLQNYVLNQLQKIRST